MPTIGQGPMQDLSRLLEQTNAQSLSPESERSVLLLITKPPKFDEASQSE
jgi:hypothetical protein